MVTTLLAMISMRAYINGPNLLHWRSVTLVRTENSSRVAIATRPNVDLRYRALFDSKMR